ncbi:WhiB family transcriptional regulator [Streptantibioticus parmotrematis]
MPEPAADASATIDEPACRDIDPAIFFPSSRQQEARRSVRVAKAICVSCAVSSRCLATAVRNDESDGIWGGHTPSERRSLVRDAETLTRDVSYAIRSLEAGESLRVNPLDLLAVVHLTTMRGWSAERLGRALHVSTDTVLQSRRSSPGVLTGARRRRQRESHRLRPCRPGPRR